MAASRRALVTFAFVSEALQKHKDIVVGLAPLFSPIASDLAGQIFEPERLCGELNQRYGLVISKEVAEFIGFRLHTAGLLKRIDSGGEDATFYWVQTKNPTTPADSTAAEQRLSKIAEKALEFASLYASLLTWTLDEQAALDLIFDWIIDQDKELRAAESSYSESTSSSGRSDNHPRPRHKSEEAYFCSRFFQWLQKSDPDTFDHIAEIANALLVSEVVLELRQPSVSGKPSNTVWQAYLDAPYCMDLLGCSGKSQKESAAYLVSCLRSFGANICIFSHSVDEIRTNLKAVLSQQPHERRGPTATALLRREVPEDYLYGVLRNTEQYLEDHKVQIFDVERNPLPVSDVQAFSEETRFDLLSKLQQHYKKFEAAEVDSLSAAIVMRRRARHRSSDLFRCRHVMLTRNPMVATVAKAFCKAQNYITAEQLGPFVQVRQAAAVVWLAVGSKEKAEITRRQLVVSCSRAAQSAPEVIEAFRRKLREIRPETVEQFNALINEPRNLQLALDFAHGSEAHAVNTDVELLLSKMKEQLTAEERARFQKEASELRQKHRATENSMKERIDVLATDLEKHAQRAKTLAQEVHKSICRLCKNVRIATRLALAAIIFGAVFLVSSVFLAPADQAILFPGWTTILSLLAGFVAASTILTDPRQLIDRSITFAFERILARRLHTLQLTKESNNIILDWEKCTTSEPVFDRNHAA